MKYYIIAVLCFSICVSFFLGCAAQKEITEAPKISELELLDSLLAQDTVIHSVRLTGKGKYYSSSGKHVFTVGLVTDRDEQKMAAYIGGPLGTTFTILWLCHKDSLCIYITYRKQVLVEPIGIELEGVVLPPSARIMIDMFSGIAPIAQFKDNLTNFESIPAGYYLTFEKDEEALVALVKPEPWHIDGYQWIKKGNPQQIVDVQFGEGEVIDGIWRPSKMKISAPSLDQEINIIIDKDSRNIEISDSLFFPEIPQDVEWLRAF